jgi:hypothetical protein
MIAADHVTAMNKTWLMGLAALFIRQTQLYSEGTIVKFLNGTCVPEMGFFETLRNDVSDEFDN